jgi:hypothetical protein
MENTLGQILQTRKGAYLYTWRTVFNADHKANIHYFNIWKPGEDPKDFKNFSLLLKEMPNGKDLKIIDIFANKHEGLGISIPIILEVNKIFHKRIISSSNKNKTYSGEANWKEAIEKIWVPMVLQGLAKYDDTNDVYYIL